jgi:hypothetical protein
LFTIQSGCLVAFSDFLEAFPPADLPVVVTSETHHEIAEHFPGFPAALLEGYILEPEEVWDEFTEFMPCFRFSVTAKIAGIVWWRATLEGNDYFLQTHLISGHRVDRMRLAGTRYHEKGLWHTVASIGRDLEIFVKDDIGRMDLQVLLDEHVGTVKRFSILDDGKIEPAAAE